jgi:hypothetical protein
MRAPPRGPDAPGESPALSRLQKAELRRVLGLPGCPLCRLAAEDEDRAVRALLREGLSNNKLLDQLSRAGGFCRRHAWALQRLEEETWRDGLTNACFAQPLLEEALTSLDQLTRPRRARRKPALPAAADGCPACRSLDSLQAGRALQMAHGVADEEIVASLASRPRGLCLPHFRLVWHETMPDAARSALLAIQRAQLARLVEHLDGYVHTHHMHVADEPSPEERSSWRDAVAALAGEADAP